ncbi:MAG: hypothetical protein BWY46_00140 [Firmicutes bacterium ADurb.Bin300]|nr:MAG: hypothetical protein BWY46_00140 [Firmicutes bacterium ADurb.Bin300]
MAIKPAICTQCGAKISVDDTKDASICEFCSTPFITEKAIALYSVSNTVNLQAGGNTIIINNQTLSPDDTNTFAKKYKVVISRKQKMSGIAVYFDSDVNGKHYELRNGSTIEFYLNEKTVDIQITQLSSFGDSKPMYGHMLFEADGKDIDIDVELRGFNTFLLKIVKSSNQNVRIV